MPININGQTFFRTREAMLRAGVNINTWRKWIKDGKVDDVRHRDKNGWRLFDEQYIQKIREYAVQIFEV